MAGDEVAFEGDSVLASATLDASDVRARLFDAGRPRLGWEFRDRLQFAQPFTDLEPELNPLPESLLRNQERTRINHMNRVDTLKSWGVLGIVILVVGLPLSAVPGFGPVAVALAGTGGAIAGFQGLGLWIAGISRERAARAVTEAERALEDDLRQRRAAWHHRRAEHLRSERRRVDSLQEFGAVELPEKARRLDVFGGGLGGEGWESFLTVFGASMLASRPLTVVDLTQLTVCAELVRLAQSAGAPVDAQYLSPSDSDGLEQSDLLLELDPRQLGELLVESIHGVDPEASRHERAADGNVLSTVIDALGAELSLAKVSTALRVLLGEPDHDSELDPELRGRIADDLMTVENRQFLRPSLFRLLDHIAPLRALGARARPRTAYLNCLALPEDGVRSPSGELLAELIVQSAMRKATGHDGEGAAMVVAGADRLHYRTVDFLSQTCARRGVHLTLMFRNLRDTAVDVMGVGGSDVAFMRLGNHQEAQRASDFVGNDHKFVITQLTRTLGGGRTTGESETSGHSDTGSITFTDSRNWGTTRTGLIDNGFSRSRGGGHSVSRGRSSGRNWAASTQRSNSENWTDAASSQRVYEARVEPKAFQDLAEDALLLVEQNDEGRSVRAVECNPTLLALPRASTRPLPPLEELDLSGAAIALPRARRPRRLEGAPRVGDELNARTLSTPEDGRR